MGELVFEAATGGSLCVDPLAEHMELSVSPEGISERGAITSLRGDTLVRRHQGCLSSVEVELSFNVAGEEVSPLPALPPPSVAIETTVMNRSLRRRGVLAPLSTAPQLLRECENRVTGILRHL